MAEKVFGTAAEALHDVFDGATIMFGGFVTAGTPANLILALAERGTTGLTGVANNIGLGDRIDDLCEKRQLRKMIASFAIRASGARASRFEQQYRAGEVELELVPQGTLAERIRAGGAGIGAFFTPTAAGTPLGEGKETRVINGREQVLEYGLRADFSFVRAHRGDRMGNLSFRMAERNFNAAMATASDVVIAEVEELVEVGAIEPERVDVPGIYVDRIVKGARHEARWYS